MALTHSTYFDGAVQSVSYERDGARASVGVMGAGEHRFGTEAPERMTVVHGELVVRLPGGIWETHGAGATFEVPGSSSFELRVAAPTAYLCEYL